MRGDCCAAVSVEEAMGPEGLEWAACWERDARGRLVAKPRPVMRLLAWTLVFVGAVVAATGLAGVALEVAAA